MFIYKITVTPLNQVYIGLDTKPPYKKSRWQAHCKKSAEESPKSKIHKAIKKYGIENCKYEIIEDNFTSIGKLALAEIRYIQQHNSYTAGLNSSLGGDGLGKNNLADLTEDELLQIRDALGLHWKEWNRKKWANTTPEQRKEMVKNSFTPEINARRAETLRGYYKAFPEVLEQKRNTMRAMRTCNKKLRDKQAKIAGLKGALVMSKPIKVEFPDGHSVIYTSKSEMHRQTGQWAKTLIRKTNQGIRYNGYKAWEINE